MKLWPRDKKNHPTVHNIVGQKVLHTVTEQKKGEDSPSGYCLGGKVFSTTIDPLSEAVLITFTYDSFTLWNPNHDTKPLPGRISEFLEIE